MATTFVLRVWTRFGCPGERVWRHRVDGLAPELSRWKHLWLEGDAPVAQELLPPEVTTTLAPAGPLIPVTWPVRVTAVTPGTSWTDTSENALYARFSHEHTVEATSDGARYVDTVTFTPNGRAQKLAAQLTERMIIGRHRAMAKVLPADPQATGVSVLRVRVEDGWT